MDVAEQGLLAINWQGATHYKFAAHLIGEWQEK